MSNKISRRNLIRGTSAAAGAAALASVFGRSFNVSAQAQEEYVWLSANANLPLFVGHDHPALLQIGKELNVKVTIAGPQTVDIPGLVSAVEQTTARKPTGMMVVGWDPSALIPAINKAIAAGIPVITVDADVPDSKRLAFIGSDWMDIGRRQAQAMLVSIGDKKGKVGMQGLIEQSIDQQAIAGFREVMQKVGMTVLDAQQDKGNQAEAAKVAAALIQANPDLLGIAGFDSESGPGIGQAIKEAGKIGQIFGSCVSGGNQAWKLIKQGALAASIEQKRELFTYEGVKALRDVVHNTLKFTSDDAKAGVVPIPIYFSTGTYVVNKDNVDLFLTA